LGEEIVNPDLNLLTERGKFTAFRRYVKAQPPVSRSWSAALVLLALVVSVLSDPIGGLISLVAAEIVVVIVNAVASVYEEISERYPVERGRHRAHATN
jgi:hypothetical protein